MPSTPVVTVLPDANVVFVVERRKASRRPDYNAFRWNPVFAAVNQPTAQANMRECRNTTTGYEYRTRKYVALPESVEDTQ